MVIFNSLVLILVLSLLFYMQKRHISFNKRVFTAIILGAIIGIAMQLFYTDVVIQSTMNIYNIVSVAYIRLLQMLIFPLISITILYAMTKISETSNLGKSVILILTVLLSTTAIASLVGTFVSLIFKLDLSNLNNVAIDQNVLSSLAKRENVLDKPVYTIITDFITTNPFADLAGLRANSIAASVIFFMIIGIAYLGVNRKEPMYAEKFKNAVEVLHKIISRVVVLILRLTPYGIFAIFCKITATTHLSEVLSLIKFLLLSYLAILIMFIIHTIILRLFGYNIRDYYKKVSPLLLFAFVSRSSAASIPLNISTQIRNFNVPEGIATTSSSFGAIIGQNGCAGIYPAMLATTLAYSVGIDPWSITFILSLTLIVVISSFGIAGVGGGATFAAIAVLSTFNMPITIVALLIGIEPLIDMARTALNINGSVTTALVTKKISNL